MSKLYQKRYCFDNILVGNRSNRLRGFQRAVARILAGAQLLDDALALKLHQGVGHPLLAYA